MSTTVSSYRLNPENAKQVGVSARIQEKGAYTGVFTRAEAIASREGTNGIEFAFKADSGQTADFLTIWTINSDGKEIYGRKVLDALMTAMQVRECSVAPGKVMKYDPGERKEVMTDTMVLPALMNRKVGLLLVREEYEKNDGSTGWKLVIVGAFDPVTRRVPKEILEQKPAEALDKMIELLADRPLKNKPRPAHRATTATESGTGFDSMDDDIPF